MRQPVSVARQFVLLGICLQPEQTHASAPHLMQHTPPDTVCLLPINTEMHPHNAPTTTLQRSAFKYPTPTPHNIARCTTKQVLGALTGAALQVLITPGLHFGSTFAPSCHVPVAGLGGTPLYIWETLGAFVFV